ncbi:MAG: prepilin-type N-terminal cleavage/methylation domain-containing protein [Marinobacter sp.]|nr:prepilin-type N-terminal cleavage/methylation domain-containing protein [Marinobacter sp.]
MRKWTQECSGFTLVELVMVIILIGVLSALGIGLFTRSSAFSPLLATQQLQSATLLAQQAALAGKLESSVLVDDAGDISFKAQYKENESDTNFTTLQNFSLDRNDFSVTVNPPGRIYFSKLGAPTDRNSRTVTVSGDSSSFVFCLSSLGAVYQRPPSGVCDG